MNQQQTNSRSKFDGAFLFKLKDTHGLPLNISIEEIYGRGFNVDWDEFIAEYHANGWTDYQGWEALKYALDDAFIPNDAKLEISNTFKRLVMRHLKEKQDGCNNLDGCAQRGN